MVVGDEPVEGGLRAGLELVDQFGFVTAPREGAGPFGHAVPFWRGGPSGFASTNLKPGYRELPAGPCPLIWLDTDKSGDVSKAWPRDNLAPGRTIVQWAAGVGTVSSGLRQEWHPVFVIGMEDKG